jgi:hypothetical protein
MSRNGSMGSVFSLPTDRKLVFGCGTAAALWILYFKVNAICKRLRRKNMLPASERQIVFITGCDSGLGFSFALHAHKLGFTVVAGCLQAEGEGAKQLLRLCPDRLKVLELDVTSGTSVQTAVEAVQDILARNPHLGR